MDQLRKFRDIALAVALLALPFFFLSANLKRPDQVGTFDGTLLRASEPIQYVASVTARAVGAFVQEYVYLVEVRRHAERVELENGRLWEENRRLAVVASDNDRLRSLLQLRDRLPLEAVAAEVVTRDVSPFFRVLRVSLDRGARERVRAGMPVVSAGGLVGQVRRTAGRSADVMLAVDQESGIDVVIARTGARGILRGTGESNRYLCRIEFLQRTEQVEVGDEVYTSGLGHRFPAALLVGRVVRVERADFGLYQQVDVVPSVDLSELTEVLILTTGERAPVSTEED